MNKYNKPWKVEYAMDPGDETKFDLYKGKKTVTGIVDCDGNHIVETDWGVYPPDEETAEYIVKCVNEAKD